MKPLQQKTFYVEMHRYFVLFTSTCGETAQQTEATPSSVFVENSSATWFSVKILPQGLRIASSTKLVLTALRQPRHESGFENVFPCDLSNVQRFV